MRIKALLTSILLASTSIAGVASASPIVRDHRSQPTVTYQAQVRTQVRPTWMAGVNANINYGFQVSANGQYVQPYKYGQDPYVEGIARNQWQTLNPCVEIEGHQAQRVDTANKDLRSIEIQATRGDAHIYTVGVVYVDGTQQAFQINRALDATHAPNIRLDLGREGMRGVEAIVVDGVGNTSFRVIGA